MKKFIYISLFPLAILVACSGNGAKDRQKAQNDYRQALTDSIEKARLGIDSCENQLQITSDQVNTWMLDFTVVDNPREVESYYIYQGWQNRYPLQSTGVVARISNGETLEVIAALKGATFNSITIEADHKSASSAVVPHDQALNYRRDGLNTVMFSGQEADEVAELIADNELNNISVLFLENDKIKGKWQIPTDYKKMISATWLLYSARRRQMNLEGTMRMLNAKINILRSHIDKDSSTERSE